MNVLNNAAWTYRFEGISYYLPNQLAFSGSGATVESINLPAGLTVFHLINTGGANFVVWLLDGNTGETVELLANEIGSANISIPVGLDGGPYFLQIENGGTWSITATQPGTGVGQQTSFSGSGTQATQLFRMPAGARVISYSIAGSTPTSNSIIWLLDSDGNIVDLIVNKIGVTSGGHVVPSNGGNYIMAVTAGSSWSISID